MKDQMLEMLKQEIKNRNVLLFVGAGVSATLGLPDWNHLISKLSKELGYDHEVFSLYGNSLVLAEFYQIQKKGLTELQAWMKRQWNVSNETIRKSEIYRIIVNLGFPAIYTTNFDHCLETAFHAFGKPYKTIVCEKDFMSMPPDTTPIIKFHGDYEIPESMVLTESSYFERLEFESPLDIKLRADMLEKQFLFLGYSLSDINIRWLQFKRQKLWEQVAQESRPLSYMFLAPPNQIQEKIFENRGIHTFIGEHLDRTKSLRYFLKSLQ